MVDSLSTIFNTINVARKVGKKSCVVSPNSKLLVNLLDIIKKAGYIDNYEIINDIRGGFVKIDINEHLNECKSIRPRIPIKAGDIVKYEKRYLPALGFGLILLSTNKGVMTNEEAKQLMIGGSLLAYVY
jgi:small subunit ribosomal protein S8